MGRLLQGALVTIGLVVCSAAAVAQSTPPHEVPGQARPFPVAIQPGQSAWVEVIETYEIPWDPWAVIDDPIDPQNPRLFRETREKFLADISKLVDRGDDAERTRQRRERLAEEVRSKVRKRLSETPPVTVVRAWDGLAQSEVVFSLGAGQKDILSVLKPGVARKVELGLACVGDDLQGQRVTVVKVTVGKSPSNFAPWTEIASRRPDIRFGAVDASAVSATAVVRPSLVSPEGDEFVLRVVAPPQSVPLLTEHFPWYCRFRVFALDKDGKRSGVVQVQGESTAVSLPPYDNRRDPMSAPVDLLQVDGRGTIDGRRISHPAVGRFRILDPQPWGYEAEVTEWHGVLAGKGFGSASPAQAAPQHGGARLEVEPKSPPVVPAPGRPPELPQEPETPPIPSDPE